MSTNKHIDKICIAVLVVALIITALFMNGERLGMTPIVDEDAEDYEGTAYFTANDQKGTWDTSQATVITLNGDTAKVSGKGAYAHDGSVYISNGGYYVLSGELTDGSVVVDAYNSSKIWLLFDGVTVSRSDDAAVIINQAEKVFLTLAEGSENAVTSGKEFSEDALADGRSGAIFAHDDLTINGSGSLTVISGYKHGITAKDDLVITGGTISIQALTDGIHANDSFRLMTAEVTATAEDDGVVVEKENGYFYMESGSLSLTVEGDAVHAAGDVTVAGGAIEIAAGDDGIHSDTAIYVSGGTVNISKCYEGLEAKIIEQSGGDITIYPEDDGFNANGGSGDMFGGPGGGPGGGGGRPGEAKTEQAETEQKDEVKSEQAGSETEKKDEAKSEQAGTEKKNETNSAQSATENKDVAKSDKTASETSEETADAESEEEEETYIKISGGTLTIINETAQDADGLDSNGDIYITGGTIRISMVNQGMNSAIDYASESGGVCEISGGTVIAAGSYAMAEQFDSTSTQSSILYTCSEGAEAGSKAAIEDKDGNVLLEWEVPCSFSSVNISCPEMQVGQTYVVTIADNEEEITLEEVSASYGDAKSGGFGGTMNFGGMRPRGGFGQQGSEEGENGSFPTPPDFEGMSGDGEMPDFSEMMENGDFPTPPDFEGMSEEGERPSTPSATESTEETTSDDAQTSDTATSSENNSFPTPPDFEDTSEDGERPDFAQGGPGQHGHDDAEDAEEENEDAEEETAVPTGTPLSEIDAETWRLLAASAAVIIIGLIFAILYRRRR